MKTQSMAFNLAFLLLSCLAVPVLACCLPPQPPCYRCEDGVWVWNCSAEQSCCGSTCYNPATQKCCTDANTSYLCDSNQTCCQGTCCDPNKVCCKPSDINKKGTCCDPNCEFCCDGKCCNCCNCEICKDGNCVVAKPTNMHQTKWKDLGGGILYFEYKWDSTTGDLNDLDMCGVREKVDYPDGDPYFWPSPPWDGSVFNPTILPDPPVPGTEGGLEDEHSPPDFKEPFCAAYSCATQEYQYRCYCMPDWETLLSIGSIERFVTPKGVLWAYTIFKSGAYAEKCPIP